MSKRYTPPPEQRKLPRNGRLRSTIRLQYVSTVVDTNGLPVYEEIKVTMPNDQGVDEEVVVQKRASRKVRRGVAFGTRLRNDGKPWGTLPSNIEKYQRRIRKDVAA